MGFRRFSGDESFMTTTTNGATVDAGTGLGVVVEGTKKSDRQSSPAGGSRL